MTCNLGLLHVSWTHAERQAVGQHVGLCKNMQKAKRAHCALGPSLCRALHGHPSCCHAFWVKAGDEVEWLSPGGKMSCAVCDNFCIRMGMCLHQCWQSVRTFSCPLLPKPAPYILPWPRFYTLLAQRPWESVTSAMKSGW